MAKAQPDTPHVGRVEPSRLDASATALVRLPPSELRTAR